MPEKADKDKTWQWLFKGDLKTGTEVAQELAIRANYVKYNINKTSESLLCRLCEKKGESMQYLVSGHEKLAQKKYER